jgi:hypothetical protein
MLRYFKEHSGAFDPEEVRTLVAAFEKACPFRPAGPSSTRTPRLSPRGRSSQNILLRVTRVGYATALCWPLLYQIYEARCVRRGKAAN